LRGASQISGVIEQDPQRRRCRGFESHHGLEFAEAPTIRILIALPSQLALRRPEGGRFGPYMRAMRRWQQKITFHGVTEEVNASIPARYSMCFFFRSAQVVPTLPILFSVPTSNTRHAALGQRKPGWSFAISRRRFPSEDQETGHLCASIRTRHCSRLLQPILNHFGIENSFPLG
jgi:hypothetical protein